MNEDAMNMDRSQPISKPQALRGLTTGPFSSYVSKLSGSSRCIPSEKDFHFYNNFDKFKNPIRQITQTSHSMLQTIGTSARVWGKQLDFPEDLDEGYDWLVNVNDELLEQFDSSVDEFQSIRKKEEEMGKSVSCTENSKNGFQVVYGKKNKAVSASGLTWTDDRQDFNASLGVKVAAKDKKTSGPKLKVPFHIPTIRRPQEEFNILVNNSNQPFEHVWLQRSEDGLKFIHPVEKSSVLDFVDKDLRNLQPTSPPSLETTPFKLVEEVKDLKELAVKLRGVDEFAVDLEHNQYRSFQGLTCLMQISTRTEDFVVDTLKLRIHVGPYLREVFKDPTKTKVMHGADRDIIWLQRDFGIYVCNLFDTGQASKVLKLERNSLEHLLLHFCQVSANKEYQNADWRLRPLPEEMLRYAREDTHYLLYIYDLMRLNLFSMPKSLEASDTPLVEVYKRSYDVCLQLYEKELLTENSYLHIYGLQGSGFNAQQLAIVAGLCEWRDVVARAEDESTGYILPNKALLEIAKQMPITSSKLRRLVKSKHPYVERNLDTVVNIIRTSLQNADAFEAATEQLKESLNTYQSTGATLSEGRDASLPLDSNLPAVSESQERIGVGSNLDGNISESSAGSQSKSLDNTGKFNTQSNYQTHDYHRESLIISEQARQLSVHNCNTVKETGATVQVLKKPVGAFGALLGNTAPKRKYDSNKGKEDAKLEQIRSAVNLPFQSFFGCSEEGKPVEETPSKDAKMQNTQAIASEPACITSRPDEIIMLNDDPDVEELTPDSSKNLNEAKGNSSAASLENTGKDNEDDEPMSLSELSSSFQKCFQSSIQNMKSSSHAKKTEQTGGFLQVKPFDYDAARKQVVFGENDNAKRVSGDSNLLDSGVKKKGSAAGLDQTGSSTKELQQGRRRQAFPATGNRSATSHHLYQV